MAASARSAAFGALLPRNVALLDPVQNLLGEALQGPVLGSPLPQLELGDPRAWNVFSSALADELGMQPLPRQFFFGLRLRQQLADSWHCLTSLWDDSVHGQFDDLITRNHHRLRHLINELPTSTLTVVGNRAHSPAMSPWCVWRLGATAV